jgi:hypothetical protein
MYFKNLHTWHPEAGGQKWRSASRRSFDISLLIFVILDLKHIFLDKNFFEKKLKLF